MAEISGLLDALHTAIISSIKFKGYRSLIMYDRKGRVVEITDNGRIACALHTSSVLYKAGFIDREYATVRGLTGGLRRSGWREISRPAFCSVIIWEPRGGNGSINFHSGFFLSHDMAISNCPRLRMPLVHHSTFGVVLSPEKKIMPARRIIRVFGHAKLGHFT